MKKNRLFPNHFVGFALAAVLFCSTHFARADDAATAADSAATNLGGFPFKIGTSHDPAGAPNYFGLPKEAFDRLSPEQIMALANSHHNNPDGEMIATLLIPLSLFGMICVCVWLGVSQRLKRQRLLHETLQQMIEKGQPIPPELLQSPDGGRRPRNDLLYGLIFSGIGLALMVFFLTIAHGFKGPWAIGLIPLFIGIAFLIARKLEGNGPSK
jgi:hypothetical protein